MGSRKRQPDPERQHRPRRSPHEVIRRALNSRKLPQLIAALGERATALQRHALLSAIEEITFRERRREPAMRELLHHTCATHLEEWKRIEVAFRADSKKKRSNDPLDVSLFAMYARSLFEAGALEQALKVVNSGINSAGDAKVAELDRLKTQIAQAIENRH